MNTVYRVGDRVTVTGHCRSGAFDAHGRTGPIVAVLGPNDSRRHQVKIEDWPSPLPALLYAGELVPAEARA